MIPRSSPTYVTVSGDERRYVGYTCSGLPGGICHNETRVPEAWLRETVMSLLRERLNLNHCDPSHPALVEFIDAVRRELSAYEAERPDLTTALLAEKRELEDKCRGWLQTLGRPSLSSLVRINVEAELDNAQVRIRQIDGDREERLAQQKQRESVLDPQLVVERLQQLATVLDSSNPSAMNVMLSHHIDTIWCDEAGVVTIRTCKLGALTSDLDLFVRDVSEPPPLPPAVKQARYLGTPRRRGRLDTAGAIEDDEQAEDANDFATDTNRFAGLGAEWFCDDQLTVPETLSWAEENAKEVAEYRLSTHSSMELTAKHFQKSVPTIRASLRYAKELLGIDAFGKSVSRPTLPNWSREKAQEVERFMQQPGATMKAALAHFGKTEPTIRKALKLAKAERDANHKVTPTDPSPPSQSDGAAA